MLQQFYTIFEQNNSNRRPPLSITFPQGFGISKKLKHLTTESGGKKTVTRSEQSVTNRQTQKKIEIKNPLYKKKNCHFKQFKSLE